MDEVALAIEQAVHRIREVAADLIHHNPLGLDAIPAIFTLRVDNSMKTG